MDDERFHINSKFIAQRRKEKHFNQTQIGQLLDYSSSYISQIEQPYGINSKDHTLPLDKILLLAELFECSPYEIVCKEEHDLLACCPDVPSPSCQTCVNFDLYDIIFNSILKKIQTLNTRGQDHFPIFFAIHQFLCMDKTKQQKVIEYIKMLSSHTKYKEELSKKYIHIIELLYNKINSLEEELQNAKQSSRKNPSISKNAEES